MGDTLCHARQRFFRPYPAIADSLFLWAVPAIEIELVSLIFFAYSASRQAWRLGVLHAMLSLNSMKRLHLPCYALSLMLVACAAPKTTKPSEPGARISEAATAPLVDLNLIRTKIPEVLNEAQNNPYLPPPDRSCSGLAAEILLLDDALGPDLDVQKPSSKPGLIDRGTVEAGDWAMEALKGAAEGLLPYRSWVRKLTGAERHSKEVTAAVSAGLVRRAYLKGVGQILGCQSPAAPREQAPPNDPL